MKNARSRALLVGVPGLPLLVLACKKPQAEAEQLTAGSGNDQPIKVQTVAVVEKPMPEHLVLTGTMRASRESHVAPGAAGKLTATFVERVQKVKKADTL